MKRTITLLVWVGLLCPLLTWAQQKTITGRITTLNGAPVPVASVQIAGTNKGTVADASGRFVIQAEPGDTLIVSSLSYITRHVVVGNENTIHVSLSANTQMLQETVVTALGVMQQKRSLGYSTTELQGSDFTKARVTNIGNALSGQVAGVDVSGISTGPGGSSRVIIRGNASLNGNNQPLYVIDGVPYDNENQGNASEWGGQDQGDQLAGINPDDIQSIQVLKSVAASSLYGYRGGNGAILITTKSGANSHGIGVEFNNSLQFNRVIDETEYQYVYGQGDNGIKPNSLSAANATMDSYGAKIDGSPTVNFLGQTVPYVAYKRNYQNFYKTGLQNQSTIALSGANDKGHFRLGLSNLLLNGIIPNSGMKQQGINFNSSYNVTPKLQLTFFTNYTLQNVKNSAGLSDAPANVNASINYLPSTFDVRWMKDSLRNSKGGEYLPNNTNNYYENPYFIAYEYEQSTHREILTGGITLKYNLLNWLYLQGSATRNGYIYDYRNVTPSGVQYTFSPGTLGGNITQTETNFHELNGSFMAGVNKDFGTNFNLNGFLGVNTQDDQTQVFGGTASPFVVPQFYTVNNTTSAPFSYSFYHYRVNSVYGSVSGGYKNWLYLTVTSRNDWFSTLYIKTNQHLYSSASGAFVFSDAFHLPSWITFGKLRASYAGGSNGTTPYQNILTYGLQPYTIDGQSLGYVTNPTVPNANLEPVNISEKEIGLNMQFFSDRLGFDVDYYSKHTTNDIVTVTSSPTSGYGAAIQNIGKVRNNGIEVLLTATPVQSPNFSWDLSFNFADNASRVLYLGGQPSIGITGAIPRWGSGVNISNVVGLPYGQIMGYKYQRNAQGQILINDVNNTTGGTPGMPEQGAIVPLGSGVPKYTGGFTNNFHYKNFTLSVLLAYSFGAKIFSETNLLLVGNGQQKMTLQGRVSGYTAPGVYADNGKPNTTVIPAETYWQDLSGGGDQITEPFIYNDSYIKVRSASLTYTFPSALLKNGFIKGASISLVTHDPFILLKYIPNVDPETNYTNSNGQGMELGGYPAVRSFGFNVDVKF